LIGKLKIPLTLLLPLLLSIAVALYGYSGEKKSNSISYLSVDGALYFVESIEEKWGRVFSYREKTSVLDSIPYRRGYYEIPLSAHKINLTVPQMAIKGSDDIICSTMEYITSDGMVLLIEFLPAGSRLQKPLILEINLAPFEIYNPGEEEYTGLELYLWNSSENSWEPAKHINYDNEGKTVVKVEEMGTYLMVGAYEKIVFR